MTRDSGTGGRSSDKLAGILHMVKHDRAERHIESGMKAADKKDWKQAVEEFKRALEIFKEIEEDLEAANLHNSLSLCYFALGKFRQAEAESRRAARMMRAAKDTEGEATSLLGLANVLFAMGDLDGSEKMYERAYSLFRTECIWDGVMRSQIGLEKVALKKGERKKAQCARECAEQARRQLVNGS